LTTTVKPSLANRSATAAPMPREAPVTIATLLFPWVIFSLLIKVRGFSASAERHMDLFAARIIRHDPASQSGIHEQ
jgi:hypothetical protein